MNDTYDATSVDQYMRHALEIELNPDEADNALTALTVLTTLAPALYPPGRTFVRFEKERVGFSPETNVGIRFDVIGDEGITRSIRIPRSSLEGIDTAVNSVTSLFKLVA